jgi:hypothetical protein
MVKRQAESSMSVAQIYRGASLRGPAEHCRGNHFPRDLDHLRRAPTEGRPYKLEPITR